MKRNLLFVLALLLVAGTAAAHGAPEVRSIDVRAIADGSAAGDYGAGQDLEEEGAPVAPLYEGAYDLLALDVREAHHPVSGEPGLYFRFIAQRGDPDAGVLAMELTLTAGSETTLRLESSDEVFTGDDFSWIGEKTPVGDGFPFAVDAFVSYDALGVAPGDSLSDMVVRSYVDDVAADQMPGGYDYQGVRVIDPEHEDDVGSYDVSGPATLLEGDLDLAPVTSTVTRTLTLTNAMPEFPQLVTFQTDAPEGVTVRFDSSQVLLDDGAPEATVAVTIEAAAGSQGDVTIRAMSDLGGLAEKTVPVAVAGAQGGDPSTIDSGEIGPGQSFSFTFDSVGEFLYHDHASGAEATIDVVEGAGGASHTVQIVEDAEGPGEGRFDPETLTIETGDTVVWVNAGQGMHRVMATSFAGMGGHDHGEHDDHDDHDDHESPGLGLALFGIVLLLVAVRRR